MEEKRPRRKDCKVFMKVIDLENDRLMGHMVNITTDGLMLTGESAIEAGTAFQLKVKLPDEIKGSSELLVSAVSRWCEPDEDAPQFYNTGFRLGDLSRSDTKIIKQLMKRYCF